MTTQSEPHPDDLMTEEKFQELLASYDQVIAVVTPLPKEYRLLAANFLHRLADALERSCEAKPRTVN